MIDPTFLLVVFFSSIVPLAIAVFLAVMIWRAVQSHQEVARELGRIAAALERRP